MYAKVIIEIGIKTWNKLPTSHSNLGCFIQGFVTHYPSHYPLQQLTSIPFTLASRLFSTAILIIV